MVKLFSRLPWRLWALPQQKRERHKRPSLSFVLLISGGLVLQGKALFRLVSQCEECLFVVYRDISQGFAVDIDGGALEAVHQPAVAKPVFPRGGVYAHDP
jgi:hypothetical protein